ncbi:glycosyltransferase [Amycolatopsis sp. BJA-103]|uniref:glycosyltransferase n=1 Tax=Amycolatopsis sp. BJA-103 TaxID=1911175 RepID=UPI000C782F88|nr:glycosyltransferase [Amycolatopsis sp. BJA-103]AUI63985.1 glycosyl transferase [Amycolatopsis sp. BJA-103]PNE16016.1 glycosyl transferase [Amycolatopsis sp. BJA-103]
MRVLLWACGSRGDVEPLVALAARLRESGAEVRMCAPPDSAERLAEIGVPLVPVARPDRGMNDGEGRDPALAAAGIAEQFDQMPSVAEGCDVVVATGLLSGAVAVRSVAEKLGIPYHYVALCPIHLPSHLEAAQRVMYNQGADGLFGDALNAKRAEIGLPPAKNLFDYCSTDKPLLAADPILAPLEPRHEAVQTGAWILPDERPLSAELEAFLAAGPPPVYVGFGSSSGTADAAKVAIEASRAQGHRVILSRGWADLDLPDAGADCFAVDEVNLQELFRRVALTIHHDGTGTTHVATRGGAPQIVVRSIVGQQYYSDRIAELGIGVALEGPAPSFEAMSAALTTALSPESRERAIAVADTIREDGTTAAVELLREAVSREKPSVPA